MRVLVIHPCPKTRKALGHLISSWGKVDIEFSSTSQEAFSLAILNKYEVIFLHPGSEKLTLSEFVEELEEESQLNHQTMVVLTDSLLSGEEADLIEKSNFIELGNPFDLGKVSRCLEETRARIQKNKAS